jgi:hypothetical protein
LYKGVNLYLRGVSLNVNFLPSRFVFHTKRLVFKNINLNSINKKGTIMEFEKLDTRLEMQAVFLPDGSQVDTGLEGWANCDDACSYSCTADGNEFSCSD